MHKAIHSRYLDDQSAPKNVRSLSNLPREAYTDVTAPFVQSRPVHGTGFCVSPHGLPEVPVGIPEGVVLTPGALPAVGGVENVGVVGVVGVPEVCGVHAAHDDPH